MAKEPVTHVHHLMHSHDGGRVHGHSMHHTHEEDDRVHATHHDHEGDAAVNSGGEILAHQHSPEIPGEGDEGNYIASQLYPSMR